MYVSVYKYINPHRETFLWLNYLKVGFRHHDTLTLFTFVAISYPSFQSWTGKLLILEC